MHLLWNAWLQYYYLMLRGLSTSHCYLKSIHQWTSLSILNYVHIIDTLDVWEQPIISTHSASRGKSDSEAEKPVALSWGILLHHPEKVCRIVRACGVLHNVAHRHGVPFCKGMNLPDDQDPGQNNAQPFTNYFTVTLVLGFWCWFRRQTRSYFCHLPPKSTPPTRIQ